MSLKNQLLIAILKKQGFQRTDHEIELMKSAFGQVKFFDEIKDELHFLDEQLVYADQQNLKLKTESDNLKELVLKENPDFNLE